MTGLYERDENAVNPGCIRACTEVVMTGLYERDENEDGTIQQTVSRMSEALSGSQGGMRFTFPPYVL